MNVNAGLACAFKIEVKDDNDNVVQETGWMKNHREKKYGQRKKYMYYDVCFTRTRLKHIG